MTEPSHSQHSIDPAITDAVQGVSNRFGVTGLEELIVAATKELARARAAYAELAPDTE
ncbi:hypothetical protein ACT8ZV_20515 [Nocardioides sp. MAHUQ-72]|uniref:hypothetical protein n=1 Tax=unclassified Nocardioides TaxID=2615069 RepID=UPI003619ED1A